MTQRVTSSRFPYLPVQIGVGQTGHDVEALLDTGFDGDAILPSDMLVEVEPDWYVMCRFRGLDIAMAKSR